MEKVQQSAGEACCGTDEGHEWLCVSCQHSSGSRQPGMTVPTQSPVRALAACSLPLWDHRASDVTGGECRPAVIVSAGSLVPTAHQANHGAWRVSSAGLALLLQSLGTVAFTKSSGIAPVPVAVLFG